MNLGYQAECRHQQRCWAQDPLYAHETLLLDLLATAPFQQNPGEQSGISNALPLCGVRFGMIDYWLLQIKINGEWEECRYRSAAEALTVMSELSRDYHGEIAHAVLQAKTIPTRPQAAANYLN
jgi:hypothetical protein